MSNQEQTIAVLDSVPSEAVMNGLLEAFRTKDKVHWDKPIEKYGYNCTTLDEVKTHIRFGQMFDHNPPLFRISLDL